MLYIGSGKSLRYRLQRELGWVHGVDPDSEWEASVVYMLRIHQAAPMW